MTQPQLPLFNQSRSEQSTPARALAVDVDRFKGAILLSAIGDALAWPSEFGKYPATVRSTDSPFPLHDFVSWSKKVGGRWWGYDETIDPGDYSDDTQLGLSVARCIDEAGQFNPEKFAFFELPLWLVYERGGGKSIKTAARTMVSNRRPWWANFYRRGTGAAAIDYRNAGANGAAMRNLPIALVDSASPHKLHMDTFSNAIVTHGHPRAIVGTIAYSVLVSFLLRKSAVHPHEVIEYLCQSIDTSLDYLRELPIYQQWSAKWNEDPPQHRAFEHHYRDACSEAIEYIRRITEFLPRDNAEYYAVTGAKSPEQKGSAIATVAVAVFLLCKYHTSPETALLVAANALGSDTDTIANFLGGLLGSVYGTAAIPGRLLGRIQDQRYLQETATYLHKCFSGEERFSNRKLFSKDLDRRESLIRVLAWEIGLHEMFWDALSEGSRLIHPALGAGTITRKDIKRIGRPDYTAKVIRVAFDCGQSCSFHSRVRTDGTMAESLAGPILQAISEPRARTSRSQDAKAKPPTRRKSGSA